MVMIFSAWQMLNYNKWTIEERIKVSVDEDSYKTSDTDY